MMTLTTPLSGSTSNQQGKSRQRTSRRSLHLLPAALIFGSALLAHSALASAAQITGVDFQRTAQGNGQLLLDFARETVTPETQQEASGLTLRFAGTRIDESLVNLYDTSDFATLVSSLSLDQMDGYAQVSMAIDQAFSYLTYQDGEQVIIEVSPQAQRAESTPNRRFRYTGERITLNYQDIPVRQLLQQLADFLDLNLVAGDNVTGNITLQLNDVPSDQALDIILTTRNLASRQVGNVLLVAPTNELLRLEQEQFEASQAEEELAPLVDDFIRINYANASAIRSFILGDRSDLPSAQLQAAGFLEGQERGGQLQGQSRRFMSERGHLMVDERTNTLYVRDTEEQVERIRSIIRRLDVPVDQIMIEARIVTARSGVSEELGVRWGLSQDRQRSSGLQLNAPIESNRRGLAIDFGGLGDGGNRQAGIGFGFIDNNIILDLELAALETENRSEVISQPKVITSDRVSATIRSGEQIPYRKIEDGTVTVEFQDAELRLEVTPQITGDGRILLDLSVNNDSKGEQTADGFTINSNSVETQVLVNDGDTIVIGGIFTTTKIEATAKTPFFGDLPLIGWMFRRNFSSNERNELLIFITPSMLQDAMIQRAAAEGAGRQAAPRQTPAPQAAAPEAAAPQTVAPQPVVAETTPASAPQVVSAPAEVTSARSAVSPVDNDIRMESWVLSQPADYYALQVMGNSDESKIRDFIHAQSADLQLVYFETRHDGKPWYVAIYGHYASREEAQAAITELPVTLQENQPWARSFRVYQRLIEGRFES